MRTFDRDLIRGGHYGQQSGVPHKQALTHGCSDQACNVQILLASPEPSTHGPERHFRSRHKADELSPLRGRPWSKKSKSPGRFVQTTKASRTHTSRRSKFTLSALVKELSAAPESVSIHDDPLRLAGVRQKFVSSYPSAASAWP